MNCYPMRGTLAVLLCCFVLCAPAYAGLDSLLESAQDVLSSGEGGAAGNERIARGLRAALAQGAQVAVDALGREDGFYANPTVRIPLPGIVETAAKGLRMAGQGEKVEAFELSMNRAAEAAVPAALDVLKDTIASITIEDAVGILNGGEHAATDYLRRRGGETIEARMRPYVAQTTDRFDVTRKYKALVGDGGGLDALGGLLGGRSLDLDEYVTEKAVDGLFSLIAEEEARIRANPAARTTELLREVFGR